MSFYERFFFASYLEPGEKLIHVVHRHWAVVIKQMLQVGFFGILLPLGLALFFFDLSTEIAFALYGWVIIGMLASLYVFTDWYSDAWLVTDKSLIDVRWDGFFRRSAQRINYEGIESVSYNVRGLWGTMLDYGTLQIIKESGNSMELTYISRPRSAEAKISLSRLSHQSESTQSNVDILKNLLAEVLEERLKK